MLDIATFFREYAADQRREEILSFDREDLGHLVRHTAQAPHDDGMVAFASLAVGAEDRQIDEQVAWFRARGQDFEWKVHAPDRPADLVDRLAAHGFVADEAETLMVFVPPASIDGRPPPRHVELRRIVDARGLDDVIAIQQQVWPRDFAWLRRALDEQLRTAPSTLSIHAAYRDGRPAGCGWTDYPPGSRFPRLHGGAVVPDARGRGIYAALFDTRLCEVVARGYRALCVDASPMSAPILERIGFVPICTTTPMSMRFGPTD